jgi:hypothetical protein
MVTRKGNAWGLVHSDKHLMDLLGAASEGDYTVVTAETHTDGTRSRCYAVSIAGTEQLEMQGQTMTVPVQWGVIYLNDRGYISEAWSAGGSVRWGRPNAASRDNLLASIAHRDPRMVKRGIY